MKSIVFLILLFWSNKMFSQDTITLYASDIQSVQYINELKKTRSKPTFFKYTIDKNTNELLNGFYKIITDKNNYCLIHYKNGIEEKDLPSIVKYYKNDTLVGFDLKGRLTEGNLYTSVPKYSCKSKIIKVFKKDYETDKILEERKVYQKVSRRYIYWKIYSTDGKYLGKSRYNKHYFGCE
jgi:hypothetical protein|nr:hypothetical protein [uncultured Capnocytophaga sp.]